jgi:hypothetical protein
MDAKEALKGHKVHKAGSKKDGQSMKHKSKRLARRIRGVVEKNKAKRKERQKRWEGKVHLKREKRLTIQHEGKER